MAGLELRLASDQDAGAIARVQHASWRSAYLGMLPHEILVGMDEGQGTEFWQRVLRQARRGDAVVVGELGDQVVGFISYGPIRERVPGYSGEFYALYVLPEAQGCGIGTALIAEAARNLVRLRWVGAMAWVLEENRPARRFYERLGGLPLGAPKCLYYGGQRYVGVREVGYGWPDLRRARLLVGR